MYGIIWFSPEESMLMSLQISTCVGFTALAKADTKFSRGLRYTSVGAVSCGRGEFVMMVGNLHKGEW